MHGLRKRRVGQRRRSAGRLTSAAASRMRHRPGPDHGALVTGLPGPFAGDVGRRSREPARVWIRWRTRSRLTTSWSWQGSADPRVAPAGQPTTPPSRLSPSGGSGTSVVPTMQSNGSSTLVGGDGGDDGDGPGRICVMLARFESGSRHPGSPRHVAEFAALRDETLRAPAAPVDAPRDSRPDACRATRER